MPGDGRHTSKLNSKSVSSTTNSTSNGTLHSVSSSVSSSNQDGLDVGVDELDDNKLPDLIELKYHAVADAVAVLGSVADIRETFIGFQKHLYEAPAVA